jgi:hypothetical protein
MTQANKSGGRPLKELQSAFMAQVLDEEAPLPDGWDDRQQKGMGVYRNNYRSSLVEALRNTYERTQNWVGEGAFRRAAAHHVIANPPGSWTLDDAGAGFDQTCVELFANDPEVAELAWLEWTMLEAFTAMDETPIDAGGFGKATQEFADEDWANMRLRFLPGTQVRILAHDLRAIWKALGEEKLVRPDFSLKQPGGCVVWREGERPTFLMIDAEEVRMLALMLEGASYGDACMTMAGDGDPSDAAMRAGAMLGRWLNEGMITAVYA